MSGIQLTQDGVTAEFDRSQMSEQIEHLKQINNGSDKSDEEKNLYNSQLDSALKKFDVSSGELGDGNLYFERDEFTSGTGGRDLVDSLFNKNKTQNQAGTIVSDEDNIELQRYLSNKKKAEEDAAKAKQKETTPVSDTTEDGGEYSPADITAAKSMGLELIPGKWKNNHKYLAKNLSSNRYVLFDQFTDKGPVVQVLNKKDSDYLSNITGRTHSIGEVGTLAQLPYMLLDNSDSQSMMEDLKNQYITAETPEQQQQIKDRITKLQQSGNNNKFLFNDQFGDDSYGKMLFVDKSGQVQSGNFGDFESETGDFDDSDLQHLAMTFANRYGENIYNIGDSQLFDTSGILGLDPNNPNKQLVKASNFFTNAYDPDFNYSKILIQPQEGENIFDNFGQLKTDKFSAKLFDKKANKYISKNFRNVDGEYISDDGTVNLGRQTTNAGLLNDQYNSYEFLTHDYRTDLEGDVNPYIKGKKDIDFNNRHIWDGLDEADIDIDNPDAIVDGIIDLTTGHTGIAGTLVSGDRQISKRFSDKLAGLSIGFLTKLRNDKDLLNKLLSKASENKLNTSEIFNKLKLLSEQNFNQYIKTYGGGNKSISFQDNKVKGYHGLMYSPNVLDTFSPNKRDIKAIGYGERFKSGGILKALSGATLQNMKDKEIQEKRESYENTFEASGIRSTTEGETVLSETLKTLAIGADAVAAASSFIPVIGTAGELIAGLSAAALNVAGNLTDEDGAKFSGEDWAQLGMDLGFTAIGVIPGMRLAKLGKEAAGAAHVLKATKLVDSAGKTLKEASKAEKVTKLLTKQFGEEAGAKIAKEISSKAAKGLKVIGEAKTALKSSAVGEVVAKRVNDFKTLTGLKNIFGDVAVGKYMGKTAKFGAKTIHKGLHAAALIGAGEGMYSIYDDVQNNDYVDARDVQKIFYGALSARAIGRSIKNNSLKKSIEELTDIVGNQQKPKKFAEFITKDGKVDKSFKFEIDDATLGSKEIKGIGKKQLNAKIESIESDITKSLASVDEQAQVIESLKTNGANEKEILDATAVLETKQAQLENLNNQLKDHQLFNKNLGNKLKNKVTLNYIKEAKDGVFEQGRVFKNTLDLHNLTLNNKALTNRQLQGLDFLKNAGFDKELEIITKQFALPAAKEVKLLPKGKDQLRLPKGATITPYKKYSNPIQQSYSKDNLIQFGSKWNPKQSINEVSNNGSISNFEKEINKRFNRKPSLSRMSEELKNWDLKDIKFKNGGILKYKDGNPIANMSANSSINIDDYFNTLKQTSSDWKNFNAMEDDHFVNASLRGNTIGDSLSQASSPLVSAVQNKYSDYFKGNDAFANLNSRFNPAKNAYTAKSFANGIAIDGIFGRQTTAMSPGNVSLQSEKDKAFFDSPEFKERMSKYNEELKANATDNKYIQYELDDKGNYRYKQYQTDPVVAPKKEDVPVTEKPAPETPDTPVTPDTPIEANPMRTPSLTSGTVFEEPDKVNYSYNPIPDAIRNYIGKSGLQKSADILASSLTPTLRTAIAPTKEIDDNYSALHNMQNNKQLLNQQARNVSNTSDANLQASVNAQYDSMATDSQNQLNARKAQFVNQTRQVQAAQAAQNDQRSAQVQDANMAAIGQTRSQIGQIYSGLAKEKSAMNMQLLKTVVEGIDNAEANEATENRNLLRSYVNQKSNEAQVRASKYVNEERSRVLSQVRNDYQKFLEKNEGDKMTYQDYVKSKQIRDENGYLISVPEYINRLPNVALNNLQIEINKINDMSLDYNPRQYPGMVFNSEPRSKTSSMAVGADRQRLKFGGRINMYKILTNK